MTDTSICITVYNEAENISELFESLLPQLKKGDEMVVVDGGSTDSTLKILKDYSRKYHQLKVYSKKLSRSKGRNYAVQKAKNEIIAMTDAGCVAKRDWLNNITKPIKAGKAKVVSGFYDMTSDNSFQKAASFFLGIMPDKFDDNFLPSTRSVAFTKNIWKKVNGFPEELYDTAEDTLFNYKLIKSGVSIVNVKDARVEWRMPKSVFDFSKKIYGYAKGDVQSKIWMFPGKNLASHNIKVFLVFVRYLLGFMTLIYSIKNPVFVPFLFFGLIMYSCWSFTKVYKSTKEISVGLWGVVLQFVADLSVMAGFVSGIVNKNNTKFNLK